MPSIMITTRCNNNCKYCFAKDSVQFDNPDINITDFMYSLDFLCGANKKIGIIGGEPTLHPKFAEIISNTIAKEKLENIVIYTNGHDIAKYTNVIDNKKIQILINSNSEENIGNNEFQNLRKNIKYLNDNLRNADFRLGYNLYSEDNDYAYIIDLCKEFAHKHLRVAIAVPVSNDTEENIITFYKKMKNKILQMLADFNNSDIIPHFDCNAIPVCILNKEEMDFLIDIRKKIKDKYNTDINLFSGNRTCTPQIVIKPDLSVIRCFADKDYKQVNLKDFKTYNDLYRHFYTNIDIYTNVIPFVKECINCEQKIANCSVCPGCKTKYIDKFKKGILEFLK